jgi:Leucine-rich repeat (LRR) protein
MIVSTSQSAPTAQFLQTLTSLEKLSLGFCKLEEKDYRFLLTLPRLKKLSLNNIRDFTASSFQYFTQLTSFSFTRSYLPIGALPHVRIPCPVGLDTRNSCVMTSLLQLVGVESLNLDQCTIERREDAGGEAASPDSDIGGDGGELPSPRGHASSSPRSALYEIRKLKHLKKLSLGIGTLTDRELKRVATVASLEVRIHRTSAHAAYFRVLIQ